MNSITLRFLAEPSSINLGGKVPGSSIMKWIQEAGYACATRWAKCDCVTVSVGGIRFEHPVMAADLVEVEAHLAYTGKTSMNIAVEVRSGALKTGTLNKITSCLVVFVCVDSTGKPMPVEALMPATPGDIALAQRVKAYLHTSRLGAP